MSNLASKIVSIGGAKSFGEHADENVHKNQQWQLALADSHKQFEAYQYRDALHGFAELMSLNPNDDDARLGYNLVIQKTVPRWHFTMMNDQQRNDAFEAAIRRVAKDKVVLDVGAGAGLLAMMAARAGAKKVYTCEMNETIAALADKIVAANGYSDKIKVIAKKSNDLVIGKDMAERADVLVTETLDSALLGEGMALIINDAKERLLADDATIIPARATLYVALLEAQDVWHMNHAKMASGFDVSLFNHLSSDGFYPVRLELFEHQFLTPAVEMCHFNFDSGYVQPRRLEIPLLTTHSGQCHAVAYWFDLHLDDKEMFSTTPDNFDSHWKQAVQCFREPLTVTAGQSYMLSVKQGLTRFDFALTATE